MQLQDGPISEIVKDNVLIEEHNDTSSVVWSIEENDLPNGSKKAFKENELDGEHNIRATSKLGEDYNDLLKLIQISKNKENDYKGISYYYYYYCYCYYYYKYYYY